MGNPLKNPINTQKKSEQKKTGIKIGKTLTQPSHF